MKTDILNFAPWGIFRDETGQEGGGSGGVTSGQGSSGQGTGQGTGQSTVLDGGQGGGDGATPPRVPEGFFHREKFLEALPEELRRDPSLGKIKDLEGMARSYLSAQKLVGKDPQQTVELPRADAKFDEKRQIFGKLGAPDSADGYKLKAPDGLPEQVTRLDTPLGKAFLETAHKVGLLPEQAQAVYENFSSILASTMQEESGKSEKAHAENIAALRTELGEAFDERVRAAEFAIEKLGGGDLREAINEAGLGTNPHLVKALAQVGMMMAEDDGGADGDRTGPKFGRMAPAEARARGQDILRQALNEKNMAERRRLNEEAQKFFKMAAGDKAVA